MEEQDERMIAREPWQRLLQSDSDAPPNTTDARIRAAARRGLVKRPARWWLPASLAASFVLAFMLVQSQLGEEPRPASVSESDVAAAPPVGAQEEAAKEAAADAYTLPEPQDQGALTEEIQDRESTASPPSRTTGRRVAPQAEPPPASPWAGPRSPAPAPPEAERSAEQESAVAGADADSKAASSADSGNVAVTGSRMRESKLESTPATGVSASAVSVTRYRSPEAWYAAIEAMRADGRTGEADRELEQLEEAHPGWVKEHLAELERQQNQDGR